MDDEAARAGAALAGRADRAEHDRAQRQIQARVLGHDDRVVAAELENGAPEASRHDLRDAAADRRRAGERNQRQPPVLQHALADGLARIRRPD